MNQDFTQMQSLRGLEKAEQMSIRPSAPPAEVEGYRLDTLLGQGAFGQVWLGHDLNTRRKVAIKFYVSGNSVNPHLLNHEVHHLVSMSTGRYIVQVLAVGWEADPPYYVMEYLENGSLEDMIRAQGSLSVTAASKLLREIAEGLSYAHSKGVLHCDLKPANVMLDQDFRPRLGDFGQSRMSDDLTPSLGTLFFMAPEQADLEAPPDAAWDVYALGAIGYSMLVGSPPYRTPEVVETLDTADSIHDRLQRYRETIRSAKKPKLHYKRSGIDKTLCQIVDRCLSPEPADRYANIQQVIEALDSRNRARTRRPIYLLGILGPLLLLPLMLLFSTKSIRVAQDETIQELSQQAIQTNKYTCRVAAKTLESEIASLFGLIEDEASEAELKDVLNTLMREGSDELSRLAERKATLDGIAALKALPAQQEVNGYLQSRLETIVAEQPQRRSIFNSIFLNDARGTNCGIFFIEEADRSSTNPIGQNFAWRSYFNGGREDADRKTPISQFQPLRHPHLSAHFLSTSTGKWKVGISAPIWKGKRPQSDAEQPIGVLVLTINLGNFELLTPEDEVKSDRFASLVDGRKGASQGALIQHPLLSQLEAEGDVAAPPKIDPRILDQLAGTDGIAEYRDPTTKLPGGEDFKGDWIAALQAVRLPASTRTLASAADPDIEQESMSDLWVLVQQRSSEVRDPVDKLGTTLMRETYLEFAALLCVMLVLWFFVFRLGRDSLRGGGAAGDLGGVSAHSTLENS
ncbi:MAG: protein kinase domain-containing protein [Aureliella sp.]